MGVTFQIFSITPDRLDELQSDAAAAAAFTMEHYLRDVTGDDFEAVWLDKTGLGILEAFGMVDGSAEPPAKWCLGADVLSLGEEMVCPFLTPEQTTALAAWIATVSDDDFRARAGSNIMDTDVEYLAGGFAALRAFYERAAAAERAVLVYASP